MFISYLTNTIKYGIVLIKQRKDYLKHQIVQTTKTGLACLHGLPFKETHDRPIIFAHGLWEGDIFHTYNNWVEFCLRLGWEVWVVTLPGRGATPSVHRNMGQDTLQDYSARLELFINDLSATRINLVGHSTGGLTAQMVSQNRKLSGVVMAQSVPPSGIFLTLPVWKRLLRWEYLKAMYKGDVFMARREDLAELMLNRLSPAAIDEYPIHAESGTVIRQIVWGVPVSPLAFVGRALPSMVLAGTHDRLLPPSVQMQIAQKFGSIYVETPNGHVSMVEKNWQEPIIQILEFFGRLP